MATMSTFFVVGVGGALGSMARYGVSVWLPWDGKGLPLATLLVNLVGFLVLGALSGANPKGSSWPESWTSFVSIGICGGLTTFSTFSAESATLLELGRPLGAVLYVTGSTLGGVCTFLVGTWISQRFLL
jgi:CrcB protein